MWHILMLTCLTRQPLLAFCDLLGQGATKSMVIDHAYLLEGQYAHELPETLIGACRFKHLDMSQYTYVDVTYEIPMVRGSNLHMWYTTGQL